MNTQNKVLGMTNSSIKKIVFALFFILFLNSGAMAATNHYVGHGVSFDYPTKYAISEKSKKTSEVITLKAGWDVIEVRVMDNVLFDGYDEVVIKALDKQFKSMGYGISDGNKENKQIPLKVKGEKNPVNVDAVKFNQTIGVVEGDVHLDLLQTLFFFSYGNHGYTVDYRRANGKYSDLVEVLSSFTFDEKEVPESAEKNSVY
jgi:hypothetical protein